MNPSFPTKCIKSNYLISEHNLILKHSCISTFSTSKSWDFPELGIQLVELMNIIKIVIIKIN